MVARIAKNNLLTPVLVSTDTNDLCFSFFFCRHCLWIVGNVTTLAQSRSVWQKIVKDAIARGCLFDASDNKDLSNALVNAITELDDYNNLARMDSLHIRMPMYQVLQK